MKAIVWQLEVSLNCIFLIIYVVPSLRKDIPGLIEVFAVDIQAESANAEEQSLFRRIKKTTFFLSSLSVTNQITYFKVHSLSFKRIFDWVIGYSPKKFCESVILQ